MWLPTTDVDLASARPSAKSASWDNPSLHCDAVSSLSTRTMDV